jgi:hypothetical protein
MVDSAEGIASSGRRLHAGSGTSRRRASHAFGRVAGGAMAFDLVEARRLSRASETHCRSRTVGAPRRRCPC